MSALKRRKRGREMAPAMPSLFIAEMKLDEAKTQVDPRERLKQLRTELAAKVAQSANTPPSAEAERSADTARKAEAERSADTARTAEAERSADKTRSAEAAPT